MFLTGTLIAAGTLFVGGKVLHKQRHQQKRLVDRLLPLNMRSEQKIISRSSSSFGQIQADIQRFTGNRLGGIRPKRHQVDSSALAEVETSNDERVLNRNIMLSAALMGLTAIGSLGYPLLTLISVPGLIYLTISDIQSTYRAFLERRNRATALVESILAIGILVFRYFFLDALYLFSLFLNNHLLNKTKNNFKLSVVNIFGEQPQFVQVLQDNSEVRIPFDALQVGQTVLVHAGELIPIDGTITDGMASIDQHILTGEAQPAEKGVGDSVFASTTVLAGRICVQVNEMGSETIAAKIAELLSRTADHKMFLQLQGEVIAERGAQLTLALGAVTWPLFGSMSTLAVLSCFFGYDMKLAGPLSVLNYLHIASKSGVLVKDGRALESLKEVDTVVFDKTGTLTLGQLHVAAIHSCRCLTDNELLGYAATAEYKQTHPIALAILHEAERRQLTLQPVHRTSIEVGYGLSVKIENQLIRVGSNRFMAAEGLVIPVEQQEVQAQCHENGYSLVYVAINNQVEGAIELHATIRSEAKEVIRTLQELNLNVYIISGDNEKPTQQLADELGIEQYFAEILPKNKADIIDQLQQEGRVVCFVGDGINDAIALKQANVSVSLRGASTIATDTAQIILMDESLARLLFLFEQAKELDTNMRNSLVVSIVPGVFCLGGIYFLHFGFLTASLLGYCGVMGCVMNAMWPRIKYEWSEFLMNSPISEEEEKE
jgi:Cu2+-exporting ATPase